MKDGEAETGIAAVVGTARDCAHRCATQPGACRSRSPTHARSLVLVEGAAGSARRWRHAVRPAALAQAPHWPCPQRGLNLRSQSKDSAPPLPWRAVFAHT